MQEKRERKLKHYLEKGTIYFVTAVTKQRVEIFKDTLTARFLLATIFYHKHILNFLLFGYVIMLEHFHLLLQPLENPLSKIMGYIKGNFARKYNEWFNPDVIKNSDGSRSLRIGYHGFEKHPGGHLYLPVWQREYYDSVVRDEKDFIQKLNYIHNNPVKRGLVNSAEEYEFSSYHQYYGEPRQKIQIPIDKIVL